MQIGVISQRQVHDPAFARRHGSELVRNPGFANLVGGNAGRHSEFFNAHGTLVHAVETDFLVFIAGQTEYLDGEQFDSAQQFAAPLKE